MESNKVKLPKEVAEAIESLSKKWGKKAFLNKEFWTSSMHPEIKVIDKYFDPFGRPNVNLEDGFDMLVRALYIGYEVEQTPEENLLEYYEMQQNATKYVIKRTLDTLNIKIKGVND